jgi:hypothetical protein
MLGVNAQRFRAAFRIGVRGRFLALFARLARGVARTGPADSGGTPTGGRSKPGT